MQPGDDVLIHAAAGGVGQLLIQLAKAKGARVIGTVSTAEKAAKASAVGADEVINYREVDDVAGRVRELTDNRGVAVVYDGVGKDTFEGSLASLRRRGMLVLFGASSGQVPPFDLQRLNAAGSLFVTRPTLAHYVATRPTCSSAATASCRHRRRQPVARDRRPLSAGRCPPGLRGSAGSAHHRQAAADPLPSDRP